MYTIARHHNIQLLRYLIVYIYIYYKTGTRIYFFTVSREIAGYMRNVSHLNFQLLQIFSTFRLIPPPSVYYCYVDCLFCTAKNLTNTTLSPQGRSILRVLRRRTLRCRTGTSRNNCTPGHRCTAPVLGFARL